MPRSQPSLPFLTLNCRLPDRNAPVQKIFNGHLRVLNWDFLDAYENSSSPDFIMLAKKVKSTVRGFLHPSSCEQDFVLFPRGLFRRDTLGWAQGACL